MHDGRTVRRTFFEKVFFFSCLHLSRLFLKFNSLIRKVIVNFGWYRNQCTTCILLGTSPTEFGGEALPWFCHGSFFIFRLGIYIFIEWHSFVKRNKNLISIILLSWDDNLLEVIQNYEIYLWIHVWMGFASANWMEEVCFQPWSDQSLSSRLESTIIEQQALSINLGAISLLRRRLEATII